MCIASDAERDRNRKIKISKIEKIEIAKSKNWKTLKSEISEFESRERNLSNSVVCDPADLQESETPSVHSSLRSQSDHQFNVYMVCISLPPLASSSMKRLIYIPKTGGR